MANDGESFRVVLGAQGRGPYPDDRPSKNSCAMRFLLARGDQRSMAHTLFNHVSIFWIHVSANQSSGTYLAFREVSISKRVSTESLHIAGIVQYLDLLPVSPVNLIVSQFNWWASTLITYLFEFRTQYM